ncbi:MAG: hypothetical protein AMJ69_10370 [Gammaproteobacteria bacterium SG8_47]|nr:MAG: hypothetical protein AMJ69_10370 [Gammaproteobacteria bacterium SG8_47]
MAHATARAVISNIRRTLLAIVGLMCLYAPLTLAADNRVGVVYPDIREPYLSIFTAIVSGVRQASFDEVETLAVTTETTAEDVRRWRDQKGLAGVVMLGRHGTELAQALKDDVPLVIGAVTLSPGLRETRLPGIALDPDPNAIFRTIKKVTPNVKRVAVVFNESSSGWLIERASEAARSHGLELIPAPSANLSEALRQYKTLLNGGLSKDGALWLLSDRNVLDSKTILPYILQEAWDENVLVVSSSVEHVKRGALMAVYPDNVGLGTSLGKMLKAQLSGKGKAGGRDALIMLLDTKVAVNLRTAKHLGLSSLRDRQSEIDTVIDPH